MAVCAYNTITNDRHSEGMRLLDQQKQQASSSVGEPFSKNQGESDEEKHTTSFTYVLMDTQTHSC